MKPKFKLNFSYNNPSNYQQSLDSSRLGRSTVVLTNCTQHNHHPTIVSNSHQNPQQKVRTVTLSTGQDVFKENIKDKHVDSTVQPVFRPFDMIPQYQSQNIPQTIQTARDNSIRNEVPLKRNDFSTIRLKITDAEEQGRKRLKSEGQVNPLYHSVANLQGDRHLAQRFDNQNREQRNEAKGSLQSELRIQQNKRIQLEKRLQQMNRSNMYQTGNINKQKNAFDAIQQKGFEQQRTKYILQLHQKCTRIQQLQQDNQQKDSALDQAAKRILNLTETLQSREDEVATYRNKCIQLEHSQKRSQQEIKSLKLTIEHDSRYAVIQKDFINLKAKTEGYQTKLEQVNQQLRNMESFLSQLMVKNQQHLNQAVNEVQVMDQFRMKNRQLQEIKQILSRDKANASQSKALQNKVKQLQNQNSNMRCIFQQKQKTLVSQQQSLKQKIRSYEGQIDSINSQLRSKEHQIGILLNQINQIKGNS